MKVVKYLKPSRIVLGMKAEDKWQAIEELLDVLISDGVVADRERALADLVAREKRVSTGMEHGLALPHAKTGAVGDLVVAMGVVPDGIDFDSLDGEPARVIFLVLSRINTSGPHIECIAEIARAYSSSGVRDGLVAAGSVNDVLELLKR